MGSAHRPQGLFRRVGNYFRHDMREIIAPTSIPDPPGVSRRPRLTLRQKLQVTQDALRAYVDSWDSEKLQAELRRRGEAEEAEAAQGESLMAEFAAAAKGGTAALKPFLANLYATRAASYRDAATHFIRGYREGIEQANKAEAAEPPAGSLFDEPEAEATPAAAAPAEAAPPGGQQAAAAPRKRQKRDPPASTRQADGQPP